MILNFQGITFVVILQVISIMLYLSNVSSWHCFKISNQKIYKAYCKFILS